MPGTKIELVVSRGKKKVPETTTVVETTINAPRPQETYAPPTTRKTVPETSKAASKKTPQFGDFVE